jgi:hypothetical protein
MLIGTLRGNHLLSAFDIADAALAALREEGWKDPQQATDLARRGYLRAVTALRDTERYVAWLESMTKEQWHAKVDGVAYVSPAVSADYLEAIAEGSQTDG